jgi:hypothetical protein
MYMSYTKLFIYDNLFNTDLINKICSKNKIIDGYIFIKNYDNVNNIITLATTKDIKSKLHVGKIVEFQMDLENIIKNMITYHLVSENYEVEKIYADTFKYGVQNVYIIINIKE